MSARQKEAEHPKPLSLPPLTNDCKHQLAILIANMLENRLGSASELDPEPSSDPVHSPSEHPNFNIYSIKEDCHAGHGQSLDKDY